MQTTTDTADSTKVTLLLTPIAREDLETRLLTLRRGERNAAAAAEVRDVLRSNQDRVKVSPAAAQLIRYELESALKILSQPGMDDPSFEYQKLGIKTTLNNMKRVGAATNMLEHIAAAKAGAVDLGAAWRLVSAASGVLKHKAGKTKATGCAIPHKGKWRVMSYATGEMSSQKYSTEQDAVDAIDASKTDASKT